MRHLFFVAVSAIVVLSGCKTRNYGGATPSHVPNEYVRAEVPWMWVPFERSAFLQNVVGIPPDSERMKLALPVDHPTTQLVQFWIDRIHEVAKLKNPQVKDFLLKPNALVLLEPSPNAYVAGGSFCFDVDVEVEGVSFRGVGKKYLSFGGAESSRLTEKPPACAAENPFMGRMAEVTEWLSARMLGQCAMRWDGHRVVIGSCPSLRMQFDSNEKPRGIAITGSANWVVFHSGMFMDRTLPEPLNKSSGSDRFVAVVAHELAHYYRTHQMLFPQEYNYWYQRPQTPQPVKPQPLQERELLDDVQRLLTERRPNADAVNGQKLSPQMFLVLRNLIASNLVSRFNSQRNDEIKGLMQAIPASCWSAYSLAKSDGQNDYPYILGYPHVKPRDAAEERIFLEVEATFLQCANEMEVGFIRNLDSTPVKWQGRQQPSSEAFPYLNIDRLFGIWVNRGKADLEAEVARAGQTMTEVFRNVNRFDLTIINDTLKSFFPKTNCGQLISESASGHPLGDLLFTIESKLIEDSVAYKALVDKLRRARLGLYTVEEEADSMAVESLAALGISPQAALESQFQVLTITEQYRGHDPVLDYSPEQCLAMYKANFVETPFLGEVAEIHHGGCYRVYNVFEEMKAHQYTLGTRPVPPIAWERVVESARAYEKTGLSPAAMPQGDRCSL